jgi:hypothetical protein
MDILIVVLGSYGAFGLIREFIDLEHLPSPYQFLLILRKRWPASLALLAAHVLFFYRLYIGLFK